MLTTDQKETCAVISMRDAVALLAREKKILMKMPFFFLGVPEFMMRSLILIPVSGKKVRNIFSTYTINLQINSRFIQPDFG